MLLSKNTPGKTLLWGVFVAGCMMFMAFSIFLYREYSFARRTNEYVIHYYDQLRTARETLTDLLSMETGVRGYFLTGQSDFLAPYDEARIWLGNEVAEMKGLVQDEDERTQSEANKIFSEIRKFDTLLAEEVHLAQHSGRLAALAQAIKQQKKSMDHLRQSFQGFMQLSQNDLDIHLDRLKHQQQHFIVLLGAGTLGMIAALFLAILTILSLTKRNRESEEAIRASEERFRIVMNGINDGLYDFDVLNGKFYFSPAYKTMLGFEDDDFPETIDLVRLLVHPEDAEENWHTFLRYQNREMPTYVNCFRMRHKEGGWRWIMSRGVGIWNKDNQLVRLIGTHTDITDQKKREEELRELNTDLETFAYISSHDLRAPLVNLKGFAREMERSLGIVRPIWDQAEKSLTPADQKTARQIFEHDIPEALKFIQQSVDKMDLLTSAVLDLSRIGRREFHAVPVDVHAVAARCLDNLAYELTQKDVEIKMDKLPIILSDPMALEQIFGNLLDNAVKYLDPARRGLIAISCEVLSDEIIFSVRDNGRGIEGADRHKVFEIFRRARNVGDERGLGMGLAYVKTTLRKLGGAIWFEPGINGGTVFHVRLPLKPNAVQEQQERAA